MRIHLKKSFVLRQWPVLILFFLSPFSSFSFQPVYCDEVPVTIIMEHLGQIELPSFICGNDVFYSVTGIFDFFGVRNLPENDFSRIEGFLINQNDPFIIDDLGKKITYQGKTSELKEDHLIRTSTALYLKSDYFAEIFGFDNTFNARLLAARMRTDIELPSIKAARREKLRNNIRNLQQVFTADTTIQRERHIFKAGAANWNLNSTQRTDGFQNHRLNVGMGALVAGGEFTGAINYNSNHQLRPRDQFYQWRYVNNETSALRQITAGKIGFRSIASIFNPVVGVQLSNAPTYLRRSFGTYLLNDYTKPDWIVELYINNVLVDHVQAEPNGFFSFDVPLMYGTTTISLRYYGPWGEEEISERNIVIPFNFLPAGEFQYSFSAGMVEDGQNTLISQFRMDYGLTSRVTLSAGMELLSSLEENPVIPFLETSLRLPYNMMLSGQYFHEVGYKGNFSYVGLSG
ncbi:MAG TPA: hypothetical protein VK941_08415, partial [Gillisia sp.]|nr:hypothetical protein [Gillisia sp.]